MQTLVMVRKVSRRFCQARPGQLQADTTYSLTVEVGDSLTFPGFPGYKVQLLAGGTVLAEDDDSLTITEGTFATATVPYTYTVADVALVGEPLEIRLLSKGLLSDTEVEFDDVNLTVTLANPVAGPGGPYDVTIPAGALSARRQRLTARRWPEHHHL